MKSKIEALLILLIFLIFLIKLYNVHPTFSDENIYFSMGKSVSQGKLPYTGFDFVHPPFQLYILAFLFKLFGSSLLAAKTLSIIASSLSAYLVFLISKKLFNEKIALLSSVFFLIDPSFLAFSDQGYGIWEPLCLFLLSTYLILKDKINLSALVFASSLFFRYIAVIYLPFLIILMILEKKKIRKFIFAFLIAFSFIFSIMLLAFSFNFIEDTIIFQVLSKTFYTLTPKLYYQYLYIGFFTMFLALTSAILSYKKDKTIFLFSVYPLILNLLILLSLKFIAYHYFLFSVPLVMIAASKTFLAHKDKAIRIFIALIIFLSIFSNYTTIDFYQNPRYSEKYYFIADYIKNNTSKNDNIFGDSSIAYYISFTEDVSVTSTHLKSFLSYEVYLKEEDVIENLERERPKFIVDLEGTYISNAYFREYIQNKYELKKTVDDFPKYFVYERKVSL